MTARINRIAAIANTVIYNTEFTKGYVDGAPHIKHATLRRLYAGKVLQVFDEAKKHSATPWVLDIGAGDGSVTLPFLELGAKVVAVDISSSQLEALQRKCLDYVGMLEIRCEDVNDAIRNISGTFDIIVVNSFLHHVPDYLGMIEQLVKLLSPSGQFFSFQDPLRYDSMSKFSLFYSNLAYFSWRVFKGDLIGGIGRRLRRARGIYIENSEHDNAEYHVTRNGVDQDAIGALLKSNGFDCVVYPYFSTQSILFQKLGNWMGISNTFSIIAKSHSRLP